MLGRPILVLYQVYQFFRKGMVLQAHFIIVKIQRIVLIMWMVASLQRDEPVEARRGTSNQINVNQDQTT